MLAHRIRYHCNYAMGKYKYKCVCLRVRACVRMIHLDCSETPIHPDLQNVISTLSSRSPENRVIMSVSDIDDQDFLLSER